MLPTCVQFHIHVLLCLQCTMAPSLRLACAWSCTLAILPPQVARSGTSFVGVVRCGSTLHSSTSPRFRWRFATAILPSSSEPVAATSRSDVVASASSVLGSKACLTFMVGSFAPLYGPGKTNPPPDACMLAPLAHPVAQFSVAASCRRPVRGFVPRSGPRSARSGPGPVLGCGFVPPSRA